MRSMRVASQKGLTLIELVAALVLCSLMMTAVIGVLHTVVRQQRLWQRQGMSNTSPAPVLQMLRDDLINARGYLPESGGFRLLGLGRDSGLPGQIVYGVKTIGDTSVLVRRDSVTSQCLWVGCGGVEIQDLAISSGNRQREALADEPLAFASLAGGLPMIPEVFRLRCFDDRGRVLHEEVIEHHGF
ncbi:MAG: prepilin-type N-terminal cleavage/methylation domain-containing protein [Planctomycetota bacterium]